MCIDMHGAMSVRAECRRTYSYAEAMTDIAATKIEQKIRTAKRFGIFLIISQKFSFEKSISTVLGI